MVQVQSTKFLRETFFQAAELNLKMDDLRDF